MICDYLPIISVLLFKSGTKYHIEKNFSADRPLNRRARRAGTGQTVRIHLFFRVVNLDGRIRALHETVLALIPKYQILHPKI